MNISTIFWDLDGTILDFLYSERMSLKRAGSEFGIDINDEMVSKYSEINNGYWKRLELGEVTKQELLTGRFVSFFDVYGIKGIDPEEFRLVYQDGLATIVKEKDNGISVCKSLMGRYKQYITTNGVNIVQANKIKISGLSEIVEGSFVSEIIGHPKPSREYFDYCFENISEKDKSRILIIGDSLSSDIKGGINAGIKTCWYRPEGTENTTIYKPDFEISNLEDLLKEEYLG